MKQRSNSFTLASVIVTFFVTLFFIVGYTSLTTHFAIMDSSNACYEANGFPKVSKDFFGFNWSLSCNK
ncbi:hypothetical protein [Neobacillus soli]|uniref:hypothetical protein n=1 Tax=Neobacillus soli TaxID=220688 RepID=UPI0008245085|nr:hypothetical protein [Neobacillus soli]